MEGAEGRCGRDEEVAGIVTPRDRTFGQPTTASSSVSLKTDVRLATPFSLPPFCFKLRPSFTVYTGITPQTVLKCILDHVGRCPTNNLGRPEESWRVKHKAFRVG